MELAEPVTRFQRQIIWKKERKKLDFRLATRSSHKLEPTSFFRTKISKSQKTIKMGSESEVEELYSNAVPTL